jgi:hypothetical protein
MAQVVDMFEEVRSSTAHLRHACSRMMRIHILAHHTAGANRNTVAQVCFREQWDHEMAMVQDGSSPWRPGRRRSPAPCGAASKISISPRTASLSAPSARACLSVSSRRANPARPPPPAVAAPSETPAVGELAAAAGADVAVVAGGAARRTPGRVALPRLLPPLRRRRRARRRRLPREADRATIAFTSVVSAPKGSHVPSRVAYGPRTPPANQWGGGGGSGRPPGLTKRGADDPPRSPPPFSRKGWR